MRFYPLRHPEDFHPRSAAQPKLADRQSRSEEDYNHKSYFTRSSQATTHVPRWQIIRIKAFAISPYLDFHTNQLVEVAFAGPTVNKQMTRTYDTLRRGRYCNLVATGRPKPSNIYNPQFSHSDDSYSALEHLYPTFDPRAGRRSK